MEITEHNLHKARIKNNCPECYTSNGLEFSFIQKEKEHTLYKKQLSSIKETLYCHTCKNTIYPVNWTDDIERVYLYHKKIAIPKNSNLRLKPIAYFLLLALIIITIVGVYFLK